MLQPRPRRIGYGAPATDLQGYRDRQRRDRRALALHVMRIMQEIPPGLPDRELMRLLQVSTIRSVNSKIAAARQELGEEWQAPPRVTEYQHQVRLRQLEAAREHQGRRHQMREEQIQNRVHIRRTRALQVRDAVRDIYALQLGPRETDRRLGERLGILPQSVRRAIRDASINLGDEWSDVPTRDSIRRLPPPDPRQLEPQEIVQLVDEERYKVEELATIWRVTPSSVRATVTEARRKLNQTTRQQRRSTNPNQDEIEAAIGPLEEWRNKCHQAALALLESEVVRGRVGRGWCKFVPEHQHSWVVLGDDPYSPRAKILDVTAWSYDSQVPQVLYVQNLTFHRPHGYGHWQEARRLPRSTGGPVITLKTNNLSHEAQVFLERWGPLDVAGWHALAHLPVLGWPSREIISTMLRQKQLAVLVPVDVAGMLTNRNPGKLYLRA